MFLSKDHIEKEKQLDQQKNIPTIQAAIKSVNFLMQTQICEIMYEKRVTSTENDTKTAKTIWNLDHVSIKKPSYREEDDKERLSNT